jgi:thermostable 8-oxoguanine DNA glycosylase
MPTFYYLRGDQVIERLVAHPTDEVIPGIPWGNPETLFTPAFWLAQYWMREGSLTPRTHCLGQTLEEEVVACLLGGYGIPAQIALAAFERLRTRGLISNYPSGSDLISQSLKEPLTISGRLVTYRFWVQKARYIAAALQTLHERPAPRDSADNLRQYLLRIPGVGFKIASWIVRNWLNSDDVAILDIHIVRAGRLMNLYSATDHVSRDYLDMERRFLNLARAMNTHAADLDALIWFEMRRTPRLVTRLLREFH